MYTRCATYICIRVFFVAFTCILSFMCLQLGMIIVYVSTVVEDWKTGYKQTTLGLNMSCGSPLVHLPSTTSYSTWNGQQQLLDRFKSEEYIRSSVITTDIEPESLCIFLLWPCGNKNVYWIVPKLDPYRVTATSVSITRGLECYWEI